MFRFGPTEIIVVVIALFLLYLYTKNKNTNEQKKMKKTAKDAGSLFGSMARSFSSGISSVKKACK